MKYLKIVIFER